MKFTHDVADKDTRFSDLTNGTLFTTMSVGSLYLKKGTERAIIVHSSSGTANLGSLASFSDNPRVWPVKELVVKT